MAERKAVKRKRAVPQPRRQGPYSPKTSPASAPLATMASSLLFGPKCPTMATAGGTKAVGPCFACSEMGYLRSFSAPRPPGKQVAGNWYPLPSDECIGSDECMVSEGILLM